MVLKMVKDKIIVGNPHGLHARPAACFAKIVKKYASKVVVVNDGNEFEIKGIMSVLGAGIKYQSELELVCEGADEQEALNELKEAFANRFGE